MAEHRIGFALHQMKRGLEYRDIVVPPPGYTLVEFDADSQEYKWMSVVSNDYTMLQLCMPGEDPHSFMGAKINPTLEYHEIMRLVDQGDKEAKKTRQAGKVSNLSLQYRTSAKRLMITARVNYDMDMTLKQAERNHFVYQKSYPGVIDYWKRQIAKTQQLGYVENLAGRRVQVRGDWGGRMRWGMESTAINYPVQSIAADQKYLALNTVTPYLIDVSARFLFDLHDGIYLLVPDAKVTEFCEKVKQMLDNLPYQKAWGFTPPVPMTWSCKAGRSWGTLRSVKL